MMLVKSYLFESTHYLKAFLEKTMGKHNHYEYKKKGVQSSNEQEKKQAKKRQHTTVSSNENHSVKEQKLADGVESEPQKGQDLLEEAVKLLDMPEIQPPQQATQLPPQQVIQPPLQAAQPMEQWVFKTPPPPPQVERVVNNTPTSAVKLELDYYGHCQQDGHRYKQTVPKDFLGHNPDIKNSEEHSQQYTFRVAQLRGRTDTGVYSSPYLMIYRDNTDEKRRMQGGFYLPTKHIPALRNFLSRVEAENLAYFEKLYNSWQ